MNTFLKRLLKKQKSIFLELKSHHNIHVITNISLTYELFVMTIPIFRFCSSYTKIRTQHNFVQHIVCWSIKIYHKLIHHSMLY